jgi:Tol biopolymer transport system component/C-terminal processing protease CtpA/Prc
MKHHLLAILALASSTWPAVAQIDNDPARPITGAANPALSPDGSQIAFRFRGDIWIVSSKGGTATRITDHVEFDDLPIWSPDGRWVAFTSDRYGNSDVFAIPAGGGETRQITHNAGSDTANDWHGDRILISSRRDTPWTGIYSVNARTLAVEKVYEHYLGSSNPRFSPDGTKVVYELNGYPWVRPRYYGSGAAGLAVVDVGSGKHTTLIQDGKQHLWPFFSENGDYIYAVSYSDVTPSSRKLGEEPKKFTDTADRTPNLWKYSLSGRGSRVTGSVGSPIVAPDGLHSGVIAYERMGKIYLLQGGEEREVSIIAYSDSKVTDFERRVLTEGAADTAISPDAKTFAFVNEAELWTVPIEKGEGRNKDDADRLTTWEGVDEEPVWSSDGKTIYFVSDRNFSKRPFALDLSTKEVRQIWDYEDDVQDLELSPDGKRLAFWASGDRGGLYVWDVSSSSEPKLVLSQPGTQFFNLSAGEYSWSPDGKWFAVTRRQPGGTWNIWIVPSAGGDAVNVTQRNVNHASPAWSPDGRYLYYWTSRGGGGVYKLPLQPDIEDPEEQKLEYKKPEKPVDIAIDFTNVEYRGRLFFAQDGRNIETDFETGKLYYTVGTTLWVANYDGEGRRQITDGLGKFELAKDGKKAYLLRNGKPAVITLSGNYPVAEVNFRGELVRDLNKVRGAAFIEFWRMYNRGFYDGNFHGRNWGALRARYQPMLEGVGHRREFAELLNRMVGELESSHSEVGAAPGGASGPSSTLPGFTFDYSHKGPGIKVKDLYERAPGRYQKTRISPGEYVLQINGKDVALNERLWDVLNNQGGRDLDLLVNTTPSKEGARKIKYRAISPGTWSQMRYDQWVERNRKWVEEKSDGKIGYVHIAGMGGGNRVTFNEEFFEYKQGKEAMIIDVRFNGGGNISDGLIDTLERKPHGFYMPRDGFVETAPNNEIWDKPVIVLQNEESFSNAEMFPYAMRERGLARTVGMPTSGYVIWTWGGRLVDGTSIRMPMSGVYRMDGTPMENMGQRPDVQVPWSNDDFMSGRDPQLERALDMLLRK